MAAVPCRPHTVIIHVQTQTRRTSSRPHGIENEWLMALSRRAGQGPGHERRVQELGARPCAELDERLNAVLERPIEGDWPYLRIDAIYVKTREAGHIVSVAVIVAVAVNTVGQRQVLEMKVGASEADPFWTQRHIMVSAAIATVFAQKTGANEHVCGFPHALDRVTLQVDAASGATACPVDRRR